MKTIKYQECIPISNNPNEWICVKRYRIKNKWKWRQLVVALLCMERLIVVIQRQLDGFEMVLYCRFRLLIELFVGLLVHCLLQLLLLLLLPLQLSFPLPFIHWFQTIKIDNTITCQQKKWNQWKQKIKRFLFGNQWSINLWMIEW